MGTALNVRFRRGCRCLKSTRSGRSVHDKGIRDAYSVSRKPTLRYKPSPVPSYVERSAFIREIEEAVVNDRKVGGAPSSVAVSEFTPQLFRYSLSPIAVW